MGCKQGLERGREKGGRGGKRGRAYYKISNRQIRELMSSFYSLAAFPATWWLRLEYVENVPASSLWFYSAQSIKNCLNEKSAAYKAGKKLEKIICIIFFYKGKSVNRLSRIWMKEAEKANNRRISNKIDNCSPFWLFILFYGVYRKRALLLAWIKNL